MINRRPIVAGNWKMNGTLAQTRDLLGDLKGLFPEAVPAQIVVCPPFTALAQAGSLLEGSPIELGAQHMHEEPSGAFTGEIAAGMLLETGCGYVIVGHSERRQYFGETDEAVNRKVRAALAAGLKPIVCVGETLEEREAERTGEVVETQVQAGLADLDRDQWPEVVMAYEPVWAIGTGLTATPDQAQEVHARIRALVAGLAGEAAANALRIQYGGSVKPENAGDLFAQPDIDGGLIGGASLDASSFAAIVRAAG